MTNRFSFPAIIAGKRIRVSVAVEKSDLKPGHRLFVRVGDQDFAHDLVIPPEGLRLPIEVLGRALTIYVAPATGHLASIILDLTQSFLDRPILSKIAHVPSKP